MAGTTLKGDVVKLEGSFLKPKELAPDFSLSSIDLSCKTLKSFTGKKKVIATVPSDKKPKQKKHRSHPFDSIF